MQNRFQVVKNKTIRQEVLTGERALFQEDGLTIYDTIFEDGESPLKESRRIDLHDGSFKWKYPLWYCRDITVEGTTWSEGARAGVWYTDNISVKNSVIAAPKNFRRCNDLRLEHVTFTDAQETLWQCKDVRLDHVTVNGDYFAMNCENVTAQDLILNGNYGFDGAKNIEIRNSKLLTKDAFWNCENVTVYDSMITGEYLGWNTKNLTLVNCSIESLQGMCYIDHLVLKQCRTTNTTLAFEYSTVDAEIIGRVDSIKNPTSGRIVCDEIGQLIMERDKVDVTQTTISAAQIDSRCA